MSGLLAQVVAQLRTAVDQLDALAVRAAHAAGDITQGQDRIAQVGSGSGHPALRAALGQSRTAADQAGTVGRLASSAAGHLARYANVIAPGSIGEPGEYTIPSGEDVVSESESRGSKAEAFLRRHVKKAESTEGNLQDAEKAVTAGLRDLAQQVKGGPGSTATSTTQPHPATPADRPQLDHPVASVIMAAGAVVVGLRGLWNVTKRTRERRRHGGQP
ncbi:hypothetical protein ACN28G_03080 [Micromonospora sp. WMMA1923]|uniref:hypothetical protein n=1 Tax=Micromonospora sp. WMMA1923 TaxID=3404125 RepID=UPI003B943F35